MPKFVCNSRIKYGGKHHAVGAVVDMPAKLAESLVARGRLKPAADDDAGGKGRKNSEGGQPQS